MSVELAQTPDPGGPRLAISNALVQLYKKHFGKGPTKARTYFQDDVVTCVLREGFTRAEQTLIEAGRPEAALEHRRQMQEAIRDEFVGAVERITGRKVEAFFSDSQYHPDIEVEVFVLEPRDGDQG